MPSKDPVPLRLPVNIGNCPDGIVVKPAKREKLPELAGTGVADAASDIKNTFVQRTSKVIVVAAALLPMLAWFAADADGIKK